jgi:ATP-dependent helicase/nuclease subunit B
VLTRALRDEGAQPVPSRWLNRLTNLLDGLTGTGGPEALAAMRARGRAVLDLADRLDRPEESVPAAQRPSPRPPVEARPRRLSFTQVETLIRDPYAIYARKILGLEALQPLRPEPDALLRGTVLHRIFARFMQDWKTGGFNDLRGHLVAIAREEIGRAVEWPLAERLWLARIERIAERFIADETKWRETCALAGAEVKGELHFPLPDFTVHGRADRIDRMADGGLVILDYKSGTAPSVAQMERFAVQLLIEALIAEGGGFEGIDAGTVREVVYVGLGAQSKREAHPLVDGVKRDFSTATIRARFESLVTGYAQREQGYTARRAVERVGFAGDYDHLSRYGEWDETADPEGEDVG